MSWHYGGAVPELVRRYWRQQRESCQNILIGHIPNPNTVLHDNLCTIPLRWTKLQLPTL